METLFSYLILCYNIPIMENNQKRINYLNEYLKQKFGERTLKICIDGNFTCPNRDGTCGTGGCIFCGEKGAGEHINSPLNSIITSQYEPTNITKKLTDTNLSTLESIKKQVKDYFLTYRAQRANKFLVYFQNFSNTYDTIENLKAKYDAALCDSRIVGLCVATRPDCINEEIVRLLKSYQKDYYVSVELGLQTADDSIGKLINRGYASSRFTEAVSLLNEYDIDVVAHVMVGLPSETFETIQNTVHFINKHRLQGIKIHSTYIIHSTKLADLYYRGDYIPITLDYYLDSLTYILTHIRPSLVVHRISGDAPKDLLIAPEWNLHKKWVLNGIEKKFKEENLRQGMYHKK